MSYRVIPPKIRVYYIEPPTVVPVKRLLQKRHWIVSGALLLTLFIGTGTGLWLGWFSKAGVADQNNAQTNQGAIPLQFDQSDLNIVADLLPLLIQQNRYEPTIAEIRDAQRKKILKDYLVSRKSPLANEDTALDALLQARNMKMILAISFVESNMCKHQVAHNCSGIGGSNLKKYPDFAGWIKDFDNLLEKRYKGLSVEQFIGYYVQPGSQNWIDGVYQILGDLSDRGIE